MPQTMWCRVLGGYSLPFTFLTSRMNRTSQCDRVGLSISSSAGTDEPQLFLHASHTVTLMQYSVSCLVFLGTAFFLASITSSLVLGSANREHACEVEQLVVALVELGKGSGMTGSDSSASKRGVGLGSRSQRRSPGPKVNFLFHAS